MVKFIHLKKVVCNLLLWTSSVFIFSNETIAQQSFPLIHQIQNVVQPVRLNRDTTTLFLADYFVETTQIDSISFSKGLSFNWDKKANTVQLISPADIKPLNEMKLWSRGFPYSIVLKKSAKALYEFSFDSKGKTYKEVQIAGEMNDWNPKNREPEAELDTSTRASLDGMNFHADAIM